VQLTESAGVGVDNEFSWYGDFNRQRCSGDGSCLFLIFNFFIMYFILIFSSSTRYKDYVQC